MKIGDIVRHAYSESGMLGVIVEIMTWHHTDNTAPYVLWSDGRVSKCAWPLLLPVS